MSKLAQVYLLLFSRLGLIRNSELAPLTLKDWKPLERKIQISAIQKPEELMGKTAAEIQSTLDVSEAEAERLARLLDRSDILAMELKRLTSRGIRVLTRVDTDYPKRYLERLKDGAPPLLFYAGESALLGQPGIAVVGSRHLDPIGQECAQFIGNTCGLSGLILYSGGARGVDTLSMNAALEARGSAVGILADSLERAIVAPEIRSALDRRDLCLATPYAPDAGFSVGAAMGRNRLIYCLADYAIVVASDVEKGGTWAGATEALRMGWLPVFILNHPDMPEGNRQLIKSGGIPFPHPFPESFNRLPEWLQEHSPTSKPKAMQMGLF